MTLSYFCLLKTVQSGKAAAGWGDSWRIERVEGGILLWKLLSSSGWEVMVAGKRLRSVLKGSPELVSPWELS